MKYSLSEANKHLRSEEYETAVKIYKRLIEENPKINLYYENLALALFYLGKKNEASNALNDAFKYSSDLSKSRLENSIVFSKLDFDIKLLVKDIQLPLSDLRTKLWGGFSDYAINAINLTFGSKRYKTKDKAIAAFDLARWYLVQKNYKEVIYYVRKIKDFDVSLYRSKKVKLLWIEALKKDGDIEKSKEIIDYVLSRKLDSDFVCAESNLDVSSNNRLRLINQIFNTKGLNEISLIDSEKGLVFGNIAYNKPYSIDNSIKISILMPVYNASRFLSVAIESMLNQTWSNLEIIAVDDCSSDNSWEILKEFSKIDKRMKVYQNESNLGAYPTRNKALSLATGDYITVHDSDDWSHCQMIEKQISAMLESPYIKATCSYMVRVYDNIEFMLRPQRGNLEYVHRSYPSLLIHKKDVDLLGRWDAVSANADDEFIQRARILWGDDAIHDIMKDTPFSFFLVHENSLTQQSNTSLNSLTFGVRHEYNRQAKYWRNHKDVSQLKVDRTSLKAPFPIPQQLAPKDWEQNHRYDIVLISDFSLLGGTRRCNEAYITAAKNLGWRVGLFHWPRFDLILTEIAPEYTELSYHNNINFLVPEDKVTAGAVLIHHPPILKYKIDKLPNITTTQLGVLVNQSPMQLWSQKPFYYDNNDVEVFCQKIFGISPQWIPISNCVIDTLTKSGNYELYPEIWHPPYSKKIPDRMPISKDLGTSRTIVIGRHSRDHWTKWPKDEASLRSAYCSNIKDIEVRLMGGVGTPEKILGKLPKNWQLINFDAIRVSDFVQGLDFLVHYTHSDYIEEFGRNIMEAMVYGKVVVLPPVFKRIFGEAAVYANPKDVSDIIFKMWNNKDMYEKQAELGFLFVKNNCCMNVIQNRLVHFVSN